MNKVIEKVLPLFCGTWVLIIIVILIFALNSEFKSDKISDLEVSNKTLAVQLNELVNEENQNKDDLQLIVTKLCKDEIKDIGEKITMDECFRIYHSDMSATSVTFYGSGWTNSR